MRNKLFLTFLFAGLIVPILAFGQIDDTNPSGTGNSELVFNRLGCNSWTINLNAATVQTLSGRLTPSTPIRITPGLRFITRAILLAFGSCSAPIEA